MIHIANVIIIQVQAFFVSQENLSSIYVIHRERNILDLPSSVWIGLRSRRWMTGASFRNVFNIFVQLNNYDIGHPRDRDSSCGALQPTKLLDNSCNIGKWNYFVCEMVHQVWKRGRKINYFVCEIIHQVWKKRLE